MANQKEITNPDGNKMAYVKRLGSLTIYEVFYDGGASSWLEAYQGDDVTDRIASGASEVKLLERLVMKKW